MSPEAAFRAADDLGIYLQPELPLWNNGGAFEDREAAAFYRAEAERILDEYGNHPSFVMFALGNELAGDFAAMSDLVESLRDRDPRRLYACGSYNGLSDSALTEADDYWTTASVPPDPTDVDSGREMVRGAAIDDAPPATTTDYREAVEDIPIPVVAHEIGQYQTYPDFAGLERYGGVLAPGTSNSSATTLRPTVCWTARRRSAMPPGASRCSATARRSRQPCGRPGSVGSSSCNWRISRGRGPRSWGSSTPSVNRRGLSSPPSGASSAPRASRWSGWTRGRSPPTNRSPRTCNWRTSAQRATRASPPSGR
ncbi:hypothetical protein ACFQL4_19895 [Halosimplex aquaticum]